MADLLSTIRTKLIADAVANLAAWKCWIGYYPDDIGTDQLIALNLTGGFPQDTHGGENVHQTFQVTVRAARTDYATCEAKWWAMFRSLNDADLSASDIYLIQAMASGPLEYLDALNRTCMTCNFRVVRKKPT
jgi:hypothetical protein